MGAGPGWGGGGKVRTKKHLSIYLLSIYIKMIPNFCVSRAFEKGNPHRGG